MTQQIFTAIRQMQVPVVAAVLLGACAAKFLRALRTRSVGAVLDASALFPVRLRRPATVLVCVSELGLGAGLAVTARSGGGRADALRLATALFFLVALSALVELRGRRPDLGCGCFGDLSTRPVGPRSTIRAAVLAVAALASVGVGRIPVPPPGPKALTDLGVILGELLLLGALSPEVGELLVRLGYSEPCETRPSPPPQRILAALHRSRAWRRHCASVTAGEPADMWRELCWWYVVYPGRGQDGPTDLVFAVAVKPRRGPVRAAVLSADPQDEASGGTDGCADAPARLRSVGL